MTKTHLNTSNHIKHSDYITQVSSTLYLDVYKIPNCATVAPLPESPLVPSMTNRTHLAST